MPEDSIELLNIKPANFTPIPTQEPELDTAEPRVQIQQKIQNIDTVRKNVKKEVDKIIRITTGEPGVDKQGTPIIIEDPEGKLQDTQLLVKTLKEGKGSGEIPTKDQVGITRALKDIVYSDFKNLDSEIKSNENEIDKILEILESKHNIWPDQYGNPYAHLKGKEKKEVDILNKKLAQLRNKRQELNAKHGDSIKQWDNLNYEKNDTASKAIKEQISLLGIQYQELLSTILSDKGTVNEVLQAYISSTLEPQIIKLVKDLSYKGPEIKVKIAKLYKAIKTIQSEDYADNISRKELLDEFVTDYDFHSIADDLMLLQTGEEYRIINRLITTFFQQDLDEIKPKDDNFRYNSHLSSIFDIYSYTSSEPDISPWGSEEPINFVSHFGTMYHRTLSSPKEEHYSDIGNINNRLVAIIRSSSTYGLFKEKVDKLYKKNHEFLLEKSLTDSEGSYIDQLIYFPEPETIRNLVLLSAARHKNYRTIHALSTLKSITKRKDWPALLIKTLENYPELSSAEKVLKNFNPDFNMGHVIYPELINSVQDFALSILNQEISNPENKNLLLLALNIRFTDTEAFDEITHLSDIDIIFIKKLLNSQLNNDEIAIYTFSYLNSKKSTYEITEENINSMFSNLRHFYDTNTMFSFERLSLFLNVKQEFNELLLKTPLLSLESQKILFDIAHYKENGSNIKIELLTKFLNEQEADNVTNIARFLRWIPEDGLTVDSTYDEIKSLYEESLNKFNIGFVKVFANGENLFKHNDIVQNLSNKLKTICITYDIETKEVNIGGNFIDLPIEFIKTFNEKRKLDEQITFFPELIKYTVQTIISKTTAYTIEDLLNGQIFGLEDPYHRRLSVTSPQEMFTRMKENVEASYSVWQTAIDFQKERPGSPLFIIANERTAPADLAAEYLPDEVAERHGIKKGLDNSKLVDWIEGHLDLIDDLFNRHLSGEDSVSLLPKEVKEILLSSDTRIIPIYQMKIPSSNDPDTDSGNKQGVREVLSFVKLVSLLNGRVLFFDESTRNYPRSILHLYNILNRRQDELGGIELRMFGKLIDDLQNINPETKSTVVGFIDPWIESSGKSFTDDTGAFVPEVDDTVGFVRITKPSHPFIGRNGLSTVQDFWKMLIAAEVSKRL